MTYLHCLTQTQIQTQIRTPNPMATLYCTETVPIAWSRITIQIQILIITVTTDIHTRIGVRVRILQCK